MAVKKRCIRCRKVLREDGTCQNEACVLHVDEVQESETMDESKGTTTTKN